MFSWIAWLMRRFLRLIGLGRLLKVQPPGGQGISIGEAPTMTAPPVTGIPESLRNAVKVGLRAQQPATIEIDFGALRPADLDPGKALADIRRLKTFIANEPTKVKELVSSAGDLRRAQEIARQAGLESEYQRGNLITGAITLARIYSVGQERRTLQAGENAPTVGARTYFPLRPFGTGPRRRDAAFIGVENGRIASALFNVETLVETREETTICLADAEIVEKAMVEHAGQFAQIFESIGNDERVKGLVHALGLDEATVVRNRGGLGCLVIVAIIIIVVLVCAAFVFSDRSAKANFSPVDARDLLERLSSLPISTWNYREGAASARHVGPTAQDFHTAFRVGDDNRYISAVDANGVALAAIQELHRVFRDRDSELEQLKARLAALERTVETGGNVGG